MELETKITGEKENQFYRQNSNQSNNGNNKNNKGKNSLKTDFTKFVNADNHDSKINQSIIIKQIEYSFSPVIFASTWLIFL